MITEDQFLTVLIGSFTLLGCKIFWKSMDESYFGFGEKLLVRCVITFLSFFGSLLLSMGIYSVFRCFDGKTTTYYKKCATIYSLRNSDSVSGSFMLGCGSIEQTEYYYYFYKSVNGFARGKKTVNHTFIVESNETPHIEVEMQHDESKTGFIKYKDQEQDTYRLVVPKGTVVNRFSVY